MSCSLLEHDWSSYSPCCIMIVTLCITTFLYDCANLLSNLLILYTSCPCFSFDNMDYKYNLYISWEKLSSHYLTITNHFRQMAALPVPDSTGIKTKYWTKFNCFNK